MSGPRPSKLVPNARAEQDKGRTGLCVTSKNYAGNRDEQTRTQSPTASHTAHTSVRGNQVRVSPACPAPSPPGRLVPFKGRRLCALCRRGPVALSSSVPPMFERSGARQQRLEQRCVVWTRGTCVGPGRGQPRASCNARCSVRCNGGHAPTLLLRRMPCAACAISPHAAHLLHRSSRAA
jgi:hypothetical protein